MSENGNEKEKSNKLRGKVTEAEGLIRVDRMYESLRYNDYSTENGLGEIVDNAIEAGAANISVELKKEKVLKEKRARNIITEIAVIDDGCGMDRETLRKCLVLGETIPNKNTGKGRIGRFGVGMTLGAISLARRIEVYSRNQSSGGFLYTYIDLNEIQDGALIRIPEPVWRQPESRFEELLKHTSGTIVLLKDCDRVNGDAAGFSYYFGRTYRKFIEAGLNISLDGEKVYLHDPLYIAGPTMFDAQMVKTGNIDLKADFLGEERIALPIPDSAGKTADVIIRLSLLPKEWRLHRGDGRSAEAKKRKIHQNEGISILRADREVFYGNIARITGKIGEEHSKDLDRWWGCEISFPPELDDYFQIRYIKRGAEPIESLRDQIRGVISASIDSVRKTIRSDWAKKESEDNKVAGTFGMAEKTMAELERILPRSRKGQGLSETETNKKLDEVISSLGDKVKSHKEHEKKKEEIKQKIYTIEPINCLPNILFDTAFIPGKTIIKLNVNHPFYQHVFLPLCGSLEDDCEDMEHCNLQTSIKDAILLLLSAYARAEAMFDDNEQLFDNLRCQWGVFLSSAINQYVRERMNKAD